MKVGDLYNLISNKTTDTILGMSKTTFIIVIISVVLGLILISVLIILGLNNIILYVIMIISSLLWLSYNIKGLEYFSELDINNIGYVISLSYCIAIVVIYYLYEGIILKLFM